MKSLDINNEFEKYNEEAQEKWENTDAYKEHVRKSKNYSKDDWNNLADEMNDIFSKFAECMQNGETIDSSAVQNLVSMLKNHITKNYYTCTNEILSGLGQMYVCDEHFKNNIDKYAKGTAIYVNKAINFFVTFDK